MGHENIETTAIYIHASVQHLRSEIIKHPVAFFPVPNSDNRIIHEKQMTNSLKAA